MPHRDALQSKLTTFAQHEDGLMLMTTNQLLMSSRVARLSVNQNGRKERP
jgi:hypothetical protein